MASLNIRLEQWKNKLLDLGKRNRLMNYRDTKRSNLRIITPEIYDLWQSFVVDEAPLEFDYYDDDEITLTDINGEAIDIRNIITNQTHKEQQKTLRNLRDKARTAMQEQGVNILYLSFGFLKWSESNHSEQFFSAPIVLVPVCLTVESITSPYILRLHEDEIVVNPTLIYKLENDFGIMLPEFNEEMNLQSYLQLVKELIPQNMKWEIISDVGLSLLSFLKINMFRDLDLHKDKIMDNPVVKALGGDTSALNTDVKDINNFDHDRETKPTEIFQVVDADSSQQDAIIFAKKGASFILQGPPGTGKSQTITNIIAECLAEGKKVLFVSEKMAALEVVQRRLDKAGLDTFCLVLHSYKANKKEVLEELSSVLKMTKNKAAISDEVYQKLTLLQEYKDRLNQYATAMFSKIAPLDKTIYDVNGYVANLQDYEDMIFSFDNILSVDKQKYNRIISLLNRYAETAGEKSDEYTINPWRGTNVTAVSNDLRHNVSFYLDSLNVKLAEYNPQILTLCQDIMDSRYVSFSAIVSVLESLKIAATSPAVPQNWRLADVVSQAENGIKTYSTLQQDLESVIETYISVSSELLGKAPSTNMACLADVESEKSHIEQFVNESCFRDWESKFSISDVQALVTELDTNIDQIDSNKQEILLDFSDAILNVDYKTMKAKHTGFSLEKFVTSFNQIADYEKIILPHKKKASNQNFLIELKNIISLLILHDTLTIEIAKITDFAKEHEENQQNIKNIKANLSATFEKGIFNLEYQDILMRFKSDYKSIFKVFNTQYREDIKAFAALSKNIKAKIKYDDVVDALEKLRSLDEYSSKLDENAEQYALYLNMLEEKKQVEVSIENKYINSIYTINFQEMHTNIPLVCDNEFALHYGDYLACFTEIKRSIKDSEAISLLDIKKTNSVLMSLISKFETIEHCNNTIAANTGTLHDYFGLTTANSKADILKLQKLSSDYEKVKQAISCLVKAKDIMDVFESKNNELANFYGFMYNGFHTNWQDVRTRLDWMKVFLSSVAHVKFDEKYIISVCDGDISKYSETTSNLARILDGIKEEVNWFSSIFEDNHDITQLQINKLHDRTIACQNDLASLEKWIDFRNIRSSCYAEGLAGFLEKLDKTSVLSKSIVPIFRKRFFTLWLDAVLPQYPSVMNFRRTMHENTIHNFAALDTLQFDIAKARIQKKLIDELPKLDRFTSGADEISILKRELLKKRKIKPIRRLFREIPNLLLTLKPCLMMSPLSVSLFLEADSYIFDTIIFDEASQVCTENAIGAILRGNQVIIAGDSKQLPPTNFFSASTSDVEYDTNDEEDVNDDTGAYESILDEAGMLPEKTLLWHYRSRHEHLIAFSNAKIYKNSLITFPSNVDKVADNGVEYIHVREGFYDRGGKKGNVVEAKKVAELVFDHFKRFPDRSLGVIAFGEVQQQAIDTAVRQMRKENLQYENFFNEDITEPFFIKNLENVQGDERDTIIFSIGYAKDAAGKMSMNLGPLSKSGGERRLNVAITRAKYNVKLVGSILSTDIKTEGISAEGTKLLRAYIDFAQQGTSALIRETTESDITQHDSPFEEAVYKFLDRKGYKLGTQVGCSGYRIDMAIKHPTIDGRYVLGVECDGAAYHSARTARERDRLRQAVLEDMGWKIYRIWSTDWIKDPVTEGQKLLEAVEKAIADYHNDQDNNFGDALTIPPQELETEDFLSISTKEVSFEAKSNPYGFANEITTSFSNLPRDMSGYLCLGDCITAIAENEYPVHYDVICKRVAPLMGNEKATVKVRRQVDYALQSLKTVRRKGDYFYPLNFGKILPRTVGNTRSIDNISTDELVAAMVVIAGTCIGITKESLFSETARSYGFNRTGGKIQSALQSAYDQLLSEEKGQEVDGKLLTEK